MRRYAERVLKSPWLVFWCIVLMVAVMASGCATTYRPTTTGPTAFAFVLTPEQCLVLKRERRTYRATEQTAGYLAGAGALVSVIALGFVDAKAVPVVASSVGLLAGGTLAFTGSQVESLDAEIELGSCLSRPVPDLSPPSAGGILSASKAFSR
jgi:hypothetical protein